MKLILVTSITKRVTWLLCAVSCAASGDLLAVTWTDIETQISAACTSGGTVTVPNGMPARTSTLNLKCAPTTSGLVVLEGAPSKISCTAGANPCIEIGSTTSTVRPGIGIRDINLNGPGFGVAGTVGIRIIDSAQHVSGSGITITNFDTGMHLWGDTQLLMGVRFKDLTVGSNAALVNTAIHLEGEVGNIYFSQFGMGARQRVIVFDGYGASGAAANFTDGWFNPTTTAGVASIYVTDNPPVGATHSIHTLVLTGIQDWETRCPFVEQGTGASVILNGVGWNAGIGGTTTSPAFKITGGYNWLRISNSMIGPCGGTPSKLAEISMPTTFMTVTGSDVYGIVNYATGGQGTFTGNRWLTTGGCLSGTLTSVRASGNLNCADR